MRRVGWGLGGGGAGSDLEWGKVIVQGHIVQIVQQLQMSRKGDLYTTFTQSHSQSIRTVCLTSCSEVNIIQAGMGGL